MVTDRVIADNFEGSHYRQALRDVSTQLGIWYNGESWYSRGPARQATVEEMRRVIYYNVVGWLTEGISKYRPNISSQGWGHARHMAGTNNDSSATVEHVGIDFATTGSYFDSLLSEEASDRTAIIENKYLAYERLLAQAQSTLSNAQKAESEAQKAYDTVVSERSKAKAALTTAENKIVDIKAIDTNLIGAKDSLEQAKSIQKSLASNLTAEQLKLADLQKAAEILSENVRTIEGYVKEAQDALKDSERALRTEQETLKGLQKRLEGARTQVNQAEKNQTIARETVAAAEKNLSQLKGAKETLEKAQDSLKITQTSYREQLSILNRNQEDLKAKRGELTQAVRQASQDQTYYEQLLDLLNRERLINKKEAIVTSGQLPQEVFDSNGQLVDYIARPKPAPSRKTDSVDGVVARPATQTQVPTYSRVSRANSSSTNKLPLTNEASSLVGLVGTVLSTLGLVGLKRRKD